MGQGVEVMERPTRRMRLAWPSVVVVIGALLIVVGFFLPWWTFHVMGSRFSETYSGFNEYSKGFGLLACAVGSAVCLLVPNARAGRWSSWLAGALPWP
jgi:hypothetical protein